MHGMSDEQCRQILAAIQLSRKLGYRDGHSNACRLKNVELEAAEERVRELEKALGVIAIALAEPAGGEFWSARKLADELGIYHDDLDGMRVLLRIAERLAKATETRNVTRAGKCEK